MSKSVMEAYDTAIDLNMSDICTLYVILNHVLPLLKPI